MRFEKLEKILSLARRMQGSSEGVSLADIEQDLGVSRRTAERMRDVICRVYPQTETVDDGGNRKRWRIPARVLTGELVLTADELAALSAAQGMFKRENLRSQARAVQSALEKAQAMMKPELRSHVAPDLEALTEAEGLAMRPGPRPRISDEVMAALRQAIKACRKVRIHYRTRGTKKLTRLPVHPYGFLYGNRHYLVAYNPYRYSRGYRTFSLSNIDKVETLDASFRRDPNFSLAKYAERSFGVFQEKPVDVVWRFKPEAADDAREYLFHPTQKLKDLPDGSLEVSFRAGGLLEMSWHLFTWGDRVKVVKPKKLAAGHTHAT
jgi:predicted DNA-binding transcriptional regulator YafY